MANLSQLSSPRRIFPTQFLPRLRLDPDSDLPLHAQAERSLRELLADPELTPGSLLPDEVSLAHAMGVSRNTLRAAIDRIVNEGRLERKAGVGTRVVVPKTHSGVGAWQSFTREMQARGITVQTFSTVARTLAAPADVARRLHLDRTMPVLCVDRVRGWDGQPVVLFRSYLHPRLKLSADDDFTLPLYELVRHRSGAVVDRSDESLTAVAADRRLARTLAVKVGAPLLRRDRTVFDTRRQPLECAVVHYRGDRFQLSLQLHHP